MYFTGQLSCLHASVYLFRIIKISNLSEGGIYHFEEKAENLEGNIDDTKMEALPSSLPVVQLCFFHKSA